MQARSALVVSFALSLTASTALGQTDPEAAAAARRDLIQRAQDARAAIEHANALELALQAAQLGLSPSLRRFIAEEQVVLNDLPSALVTSQACVRESEREAPSPSRDEHMAACRALVTSLQARVGRLVVVVPTTVDRTGLEVRVADRVVAPSEYGIARYVMTGVVPVEAHSPTAGEFHANAIVAAGATVNVTIQPIAALLFNRPGEHRHRMEFEGHLSAYNPLYCHGAGFGGGARLGIPLLRNGFIRSVNNNIALSFGADLFYNSDQRCRSTALHVPVALQWNFFLTGAWSVFFEPTVLVTLPVNTGKCSASAGTNENGCNEVLVMPGASLGARWHYNSDGHYPTVILRAGWPLGFNLGMTF